PPPPPPVQQVAAPLPPEPAVADDGDPGPIPVSAADPSWGQPDALVTIVEFGNFQCKFSRKVEPTLAELERNYGPEQIRVVWKSFPTTVGEYARPAAAAAMLLYARRGNDAFWSAHDAFYAEQDHLDEIAVEVPRRAGLRADDPALLL